MSDLEKQLESSLALLEYRLEGSHKEVIETRRMLVAERIRNGTYTKRSGDV